MAKRKCSVCRKFVAPEKMLRTSTAVGNICSPECLTGLQLRKREKAARRHARKENGLRRDGTRRLPGACRERVRRRDRGICRWCGTDRNLNIHHVRYRSEGGPDNPRNLITLCTKCHARAHSNKRLYQPLLLVWLWLTYEKQVDLTVDAARRLAVDNPDWYDVARHFTVDQND